MTNGDDDGYLQIDPFTRAWGRGVELAGSRYFRHDANWSYTVMHPHVDDIKKDLERMPTGEAVFLAAMVSFYNGDTGGRMLRTLQASGLGDIAARLSPEQREVLAELIVTFERW